MTAIPSLVVREIIADKLGLDPNSVKDTSRVESDLGADSLDVTEIVMDIEDKFCIEIFDEEICDIETVAQAISVVETKLKEKEASK